VLARLGSALVLIGIVVMLVFLVMGTSGQMSLELLVTGAAVSAVGLLLRRRAAQRRPSRRFETLRRMMGDDEPDVEA
jgi:hypothetical protein